MVIMAKVSFRWILEGVKVRVRRTIEEQDSID